jgi:predicted metal-binding membrane protein
MLRVDVDLRRSCATAASLVLSAWLALALWSLSPYAEWLDHSQIEEIAAPPTLRLAVFTLGWTLMIIAMMLPSTLLLLDRCLENQPLSARRIVPVVLTYLAVWTVFGSFIYLGDSALHEMVERVPALEGVIVPGVLLLAGIYQFTSIKRACLSRCRPEGAAFQTVGQASSHNLWAMGLRHGLNCLGSGWALMLLVFAIGGVNLFWMLVLGMIMAAERLSQQGDEVARCLGILLIIGSVLLVIV